MMITDFRFKTIIEQHGSLEIRFFSLLTKFLKEIEL